MLKTTKMQPTIAICMYKYKYYIDTCIQIPLLNGLIEKSPTNRILHDHVMVNLLYSIPAVPYTVKPSMRINFRPFSISYYFPPACNRVASIYVYGRMSTGGGQSCSHHTCPYRTPCLHSNPLPQNYSFCMVSIISGF